MNNIVQVVGYGVLFIFAVVVINLFVRQFVFGVAGFILSDYTKERKSRPPFVLWW